MWKVARGVPIPKPKKDNYDLAKNYRTISLLNCLGKVVERVATEVLSQHCEGGDTLHDGQFGARRRRSAVEAVGRLIGWVEDGWKRKEITGALCMDVRAAFPSVARGCLLRRMREMEVDEELVRWTDSFMSDRRVRMVVDGGEGQEIGVITGLPQGSSVSPLLFNIYISGVHEAGEGGGSVRSLSFVDDVTWVAQGRSVQEVRAKLEAAARRAIGWGGTNGVSFEAGKTEAILFSRNRRHWRDRGHERIRIGDHRIPFNARATRWLGIYLDSRLSFTEHTRVSARKARAAERRLTSMVARHGVPPLSARHLQEAIV